MNKHLLSLCLLLSSLSAGDLAAQSLINPYLPVKTEVMSSDKDYLRLNDVDLGDHAAAELRVRAASLRAGGRIAFHLDSPKGEKIAEVVIPSTGSWESWQDFTTPVAASATGKHDLYLTFSEKGTKRPKMESWQLSTSVPNPWMWSDVPDPDIIRVGEYYYLVSTTMHLMPGAPVMRSRDLISWQTVSYLFDEIHDTPRYYLADPDHTGTVYGRGQWATSIRYHEFKSGPFAGQKLFFALFCANDEPHRSCLYVTEDPALGWRLHARLPHYHDSSLFFDDDDKCYVFSGSGLVRVVELNATLTDEQPGGISKALNNRELQPEGLLEGSRVIKHDGYYYLIMIAWPRDGRQQLAYRSRTIDGPYEKKVILKSQFGGFNYVGQGTIVDGKHGEWYGVIFQDRDGVGRVLTLNPCRWQDGWPILGDADGKVPEVMNLYAEEPKSLQQPGVSPYIQITQSDDFGLSSTLFSAIPHWQWNHNPVDEKWSLTERPGYLRLHTVGQAATLYHARNTLTQRMDGPTCEGSISLDISQMKEGDRAGFAAFNGHSGILTIERENAATSLVLSYEEVTLTPDAHAIEEIKREEVARIDLKDLQQINLRITGDFQPGHKDNATFWYSFDGGQNWQQIGGDYQMRFDYRRLFMGTKFAIFNYSTNGNGGYVDVDAFEYKH